MSNLSLKGYGNRIKNIANEVSEKIKNIHLKLNNDDPDRLWLNSAYTIYEVGDKENAKKRTYKTYDYNSLLDDKTITIKPVVVESIDNSTDYPGLYNDNAT